MNETIGKSLIHQCNSFTWPSFDTVIVAIVDLSSIHAGRKKRHSFSTFIRFFFFAGLHTFFLLHSHGFLRFTKLWFTILCAIRCNSMQKLAKVSSRPVCLRSEQQRVRMVTEKKEPSRLIYSYSSIEFWLIVFMFAEMVFFFIWFNITMPLKTLAAQACLIHTNHIWRSGAHCTSVAESLNSRFELTYSHFMKLNWYQLTHIYVWV